MYVSIVLLIIYIINHINWSQLLYFLPLLVLISLCWNNLKPFLNLRYLNIYTVKLQKNLFAFRVYSVGWPYTAESNKEKSKAYPRHYSCRYCRSPWLCGIGKPASSSSPPLRGPLTRGTASWPPLGSGSRPSRSCKCCGVTIQETVRV